MNHDHDIQTIDRVELLINRRLDHQNTAAEEAELDQLLSDSESARAMLAEYVRNDLLASQTLRADADSVRQAPAQHKSGWRTMIAAAVLSAAAVIAISFVPDFWKPSTPIERVAIQNHQPSPSVGRVAPSVPAQFVDYKPVDAFPRQRQRDLQRDVIGVQSDDPNVIYVFERNTLKNRLVPVSGEF